jgi:hypothetical protein
MANSSTRGAPVKARGPLAGALAAATGAAARVTGMVAVGVTGGAGVEVRVAFGQVAVADPPSAS